MRVILSLYLGSSGNKIFLLMTNAYYSLGVLNLNPTTPIILWLSLVFSGNNMLTLNKHISRHIRSGSLYQMMFAAPRRNVRCYVESLGDRAAILFFASVICHSDANTESPITKLSNFKLGILGANDSIYLALYLLNSK